jgi:hypothetical protein
MLISVAALGVLVFVGALLASSVALGAGYLLNHLFSIGLIPGTVIFLASGSLGVIALGMMMIHEQLEKRLRIEEGEWGWEDDDEEEDQPMEEIQSGRSPGLTQPSVSRNHPCPCGSGKKYKRCCLNRSDSTGSDQDVIHF